MGLGVGVGAGFLLVVINPLPSHKLTFEMLLQGWTGCRRDCLPAQEEEDGQEGGGEEGGGGGGSRGRHGQLREHILGVKCPHSCHLYVLENV